MKKIISIILTAVMVCSVFAAFDMTAFAASAKLATAKISSVSNTAKGITVKWSKTSGAKKFVVTRKAPGQKKYYSIKTIKSAKTLNYTDSKVSAGKVYSYKIKAVNGKKSTTSGAKSIRRLLAPSKVNAANYFNSKTYDFGARVSWTKAAGVKKYEVYRKTTGKYSKIATTTSTAYLDDEALSGVTYYYSVRAVNGTSKSTYSKAKKLVYVEAAGLEALPLAGGMKLMWGSVSGVTGYKLYKTTAGSSSYSLIKTLPARTYTYLDKNVKLGTYYKYYIVAYKGSATSAKSTANCKYSGQMAITVKAGETSTKLKSEIDTMYKELSTEMGMSVDEIKVLIKINFQSVNSNIATIDDDYTVTGVAPGTTNAKAFISMLGEKQEIGFIVIKVTE